jgi:hypothetical protein
MPIMAAVASPAQQWSWYSRSQQAKMGAGMPPKDAAWIEATRKTAEQMKRDAVCYVTAIPRQLLEGRVLVHNDVTPQPKIRICGFRAWTQRKTDQLVQCHCDWAEVDLYGLPHYRVRG